MITPKRPSGFNEFLPADQLAFNAMLSVIKMTYEQHGYTPIETPAIELAEVIHAKEGGESAKQGYRFTKGDTDLALRFDLTVPLARYAAEHYNDLAFPFRRYQIQEVWRAEKPQAGRYRQFYQCDIDILGSSSVIADTDILLTMRNTMQALDLKHAVLHISNRKLFSSFIEEKKLSKYSVEILRVIDKLDKQGRAKTVQSLSDLGIKQPDAQAILDLAGFNGSAATTIKQLAGLGVKNQTFKDGLEELSRTCDLLKAAGVPDSEYIINLGVVRGLDYYTGMVFEIMLKDKPEVGSIGGGGRYDNLLGHYRREAVPGVGASIGLSRLFATLDLSDGPSSPSQALIIALHHDLLPYCYEVARKLRSAGLNVEIYPKEDKMGKQLSYADKAGIPFVIVCGEDEVKEKTVTVKNMETGAQKTLPLKSAAAFVKKDI